MIIVKSTLLILGVIASNYLMGQSEYVVLTNQSAINELSKGAIISELDETELPKITMILEACVAEYNSEVEQSFRERGEGKYAKMYKIKKLKNYKIQFVPYLNTRGEKEVWINGFGDKFNTNWKSEIVTVLDGGNCYFQIRINLENELC